MTTSAWISGVLIVGGVLAFMLLRERWRLRATESWAARRQFRLLTPFAPDAEMVPAKELSMLFTVNGAIRWGAAVQGEVNGVPVWMMECEASRAGMTSAWYTLVAWPAAGSPETHAMGVGADQPAAMSTLAAPSTIKLSAGYACFRLEGVMTPALIDQAERTLAAFREKPRD